jgi:hypothetical protein
LAFPEGWGRKCELVIQASQVSGNLTNFPLLLTDETLPAEMLDSGDENAALDGGGDIVITSDEDGSTRLAIEIVKFTLDSTAQIWVKVPSISSATNTSIWIWYKKAGESQPARDSADPPGSELVWDSNYVLSMHVEEDPSGGATIFDSTANTTDGTANNMASGDSVAAKIGNGLSFNATDADESVSWAADTIGTLTNGAASASYEAWVSAAANLAGALPQAIAVYIATGQNGFNLRIDDQGGGNFKFRAGGRSVSGEGFESRQSAASFAFGTTLHHIQADYDYANDTIDLYIDGSLDGQTSVTFNNTTYTQRSPATIDSLFITTPHIVRGRIDEFRFSKLKRGADHASASYNNQNSPSTFVIEGVPEDVTPAAAVVEPDIGIGKLLLAFNATTGTNMNFETGNTTGWAINAQSGANAALSATTPGNQGTWTGQVLINSMGTNDIDVTLISTPGFAALQNHFYWIAFDGIVTDPASGFKQVTPRVSLVGCAASSLGIIPSSTKTLTAAWQRFNCLVKTDTTTNAQLYFTMGTSGTTVQIDDVFIQEVFEIFPERDFVFPIERQRSNIRTKSQLYTWDFGIKTKRYQIREEWVNSYTASHIQSFWQTDATIRIIEDSDTPGTFQQVKIAQSQRPSNMYQQQLFEEYLRTGLNLESISTVT